MLAVVVTRLKKSFQFDEITSDTDTSWKAQRSLGKGRGRRKGRTSIKERGKIMPTGILTIPSFQNLKQFLASFFLPSMA